MMHQLGIVSTQMSISNVIFQRHLWEQKQPLQMILLLILMLFPKVSHGSSCGDSLLPPVENPKDGACGEMDVRNSVKNFRMLENCTVIEGSLHISLIDYVPQEEYNKYSFPLLREITGHFMMFRVFGLRTLRNIFPNLAVIRGQTKFFNDYALVAYEMRDLEELGLIGLTLINGSVRLTRNHKLCHISSIDWSRLAQGIDPSKHLFLDNREKQLCPDYCNESCPSTLYQGITRKRCWTSKQDGCQRNLVCQCPKGESCAPNGSCCSEHCMGGCSGPSASDCYVCSKVIYRNKCQSHCPSGTYMLSNRRCLTDNECLSLLSHSAHVNRSDSSDNFPKILIGDGVTPSQCVFKCPPGYTVNDKEDQNIPKCIRCKGFCPKVCNTTIVSSIQDSEKLFGCSKIDGSLEIQITGGEDIDYGLTKNLGQIREVTGYVKVWKSYPLLTLHFFQDLEIIGGDKVAHKGYSLFVADNTNLQELFPEQQMQKMVIKKGRIGFHGNRKLCFSKISSFSKQMNITSQWNEERVDISNTSNGNLIPCLNSTLKLELTFKQLLHLRWEKYPGGDRRQLINYIINYKELKESVRDIFQGRDACSDNDWKTMAVKPQEDPQTALIGLKPFTKYAIYVQASTLSNAGVSAMSNILYFQTSPFTPTEPTNLEVSSSDPRELTVKWNSPKSPNGNVTHYKIFYQQQSSSTNGFEQRDFCKDPIVNTKEVQKEEVKKNLEEEKKQKEAVTDHAIRCCGCPMSEEEKLKQQTMKELEIVFENDLHDSTYLKKWGNICRIDTNNVNLDGRQKTYQFPKNNRLRRDADNSSKSGLYFNNPLIFHFQPREGDLNKNDTLTNTDESASNISNTEPFNSYPRQEAIVYDTMVTLSNLEHFYSYNIEVVACHETDSVTGIKLCGSSAIITGQTAANPISDNLNSSLVVVEPVLNKSGEVLIKWEPPPMPNGLILKYYLKYRKVDLDRNSIPVIVCVSAKQFQNSSNGHVLLGLLSGNYSLQISAHSQAGNGTYTQEMFFYVPPKHEGEGTDSLGLIVGICSGLAVLIILIGVAVCCRYRYVDSDVIVSRNPEYIPTDQLYAPDEWEVPRDTIRLIKELGQGSFGTVFEGLMEDHETKASTPVAVKTVNDKADFHERLKILKEASTMKVFECHHVVKLLGVVSRGQPALVIMELMALGDLRNYLRRCRLDEENYPELCPPTSEQIYQMAGEIADGMAYLSDQKIVHRDLAARNCLVSEDGTVKIADFGMARDVYTTDYYRKDQGALLPIRWMAPESLKDGIFTTMSDIWSYGLVLWEIVTLAEQPYPGLINEQVMIFITEGKILKVPEMCPEDLKDIMQRCWTYNPKHRPTFKTLLDLLVPFLNDRFHEVSYYFKEVVRSEAEDEREEKAIEGYAEELNLENEEDEKTEADQDFDGEDSLMVGSSPFDDEDIERREENGPYTAQTTQSVGSLSHVGGSHTNQTEHFPLIQHQHNMQEPFLYPAFVSAGNLTEPGDLYSDDDIDSDNDFIAKDDSNYIRPSKDAKSSSERLKLLSNSPDSSRLKLEILPIKPSTFAVKPGGSGSIDEYSLTAGSSKVGEDKNIFSSSSVPSHLAISSAVLSNPPPFSFANLQPSVASSASPILHVDMEGIGKMSGTNQNKSTAPNLLEHEGGESSWLFKNNNPTSKSNARNSHMKLSESSSNSNSNSNSIQNSSEGSKESSSSSGSHSRFNSGTANGHGPFTHQQTALC